MVSYSALKPTTKQLRTVLILVVVEDGLVHFKIKIMSAISVVLILIVVEDGLVHFKIKIMSAISVVLILIVVEDGLVLAKSVLMHTTKPCLNPYCSGRWSRTWCYSFCHY